jgi:hypothetical protein
MSIPTVSSRVNVKDLHPKFKARLEAFFADPRIKGKVSVVSGVRTYQQQKYLYDGYKSRKPGFNLAANPDRVTSAGFQGSYHMSQPKFDGYGYAVDFRIVKKGSISTTQVNKIAAEYGIVKTVPSEWWHHSPCRVSGGKMEWFPVKSGVKTPKPVSVKSEQAKVFEFIAACLETVVRKGDKGPVVEFLQKMLDKNGYKLTSRPRKNSGVDGDFGPKTLRAVKQFQRDEGLAADGVVGPKTWKALID